VQCGFWSVISSRCSQLICWHRMEATIGPPVTLVSGPHVDYTPPPSVGIGVGGFGFSGCCSGFGLGLGVGLPLGRPTPSHVTDQYVGFAVITAPVDYTQAWKAYRLEIQVGNRPVVTAAPAPSAG
jgi:hypothetical protein